MRKLRERTIRSAKPQDKEYRLNDGEGLYLRVRPSGSKTWLALIRHQGKNYTKTLGNYPEITLAQARELNQDFRRTVQHGVVNLSGPSSVSELFSIWFEDYVEKVRTSEENNEALKSRFERYVLSEIGSLKLEEVRRGLIVQTLDKVVKLGYNRVANLLLSEIRQMFTYAAVREWILGDPTVGISKIDVGGHERPSERFLTKDELRLIKSFLRPHAPSGEVNFFRVINFRTEMALLLGLSTLARSIEIASAHSDFIDLNSNTWIIPDHITKNKTEHLVHLNCVSRKVFSLLIEEYGPGFLFKSSSPRGYVDPRTFTRTLVDRQGREKPLKGRRNSTELSLPGGRWTMHDLRRTGATMMGELGISNEVIDLCLNHKEVDKVRRTYQKQQRLAERQQAFELLGEELKAIFGGLDWITSP